MESEVPCVLVVEDEALLAFDLEHELLASGYKVEVATNGDDAITLLDGPGKFAAVLSDIRLGSGSDGWAVAKHARRIDPKVPIVYMSGNSSADWASEGVPGSLMLTKPFAMAQLITAVSGLINQVSSS